METPVNINYYGCGKPVWKFATPLRCDRTEPSSATYKNENL